MARSIVLSYERTTIFQMEVSGKDLTKLADHLGIDRKDLLKLIRDEFLQDEYVEELYTFIVDHEGMATVSEEGDVTNLETEYVNE